MNEAELVLFLTNNTGAIILAITSFSWQILSFPEIWCYICYEIFWKKLTQPQDILYKILFTSHYQNHDQKEIVFSYIDNTV